MADPHETLADVAARYQFSPRQLRELTRRRGIPVLHTGRQIRFDAAALQKLNECLRTQPPQPEGALSERPGSATRTGSVPRYSATYERVLNMLAPERKQKPTAGFVYFIRLDDTIKIGTAANPAERLAALQIGTPGTLRLIGTMPGGAAAERRMHQQFREYRIRGEWFRIEGRFARFIKRQFGDG